MKVLFVLAGLVAAATAFANYGNWNQGMGNQGMGNHGTGNQGQNWWQYLMGNNGGQNNGGNNGGPNNGGYNGGYMQGGGNHGQMGGSYGHGQPNMGMNPMVMMMMMNMMKNMMGQQEDKSKDRDDEKEWEQFEKFVDYKKTMELTESIMKQIAMKKANAEFEKAVLSHCMLVYAKKEFYKHINYTVRDLVSEKKSEDWGEKVMEMDFEEGVGSILEVLQDVGEGYDGMDILADLDLKIGAWICEAGHNLEAAVKDLESKSCHSGMGMDDMDSSSSESEEEPRS